MVTLICGIRGLVNACFVSTPWSDVRRVSAHAWFDARCRPILVDLRSNSSSISSLHNLPLAEGFGEASHPGPQSKIQAFFRPRLPSPPSSAPASQCPHARPLQLHEDSLSDIVPDDKGTFQMAVVNPTSVHQKAKIICDLGSDFVFLSEASAVQMVQQNVSKEFRQQGCTSVWGCPVEPHFSPHTGLRGHAAGVALVSTLPLSAPPVPLPAETLATQRVVEEGMARIGTLQVRTIAVYGFALSYPDSQERNEALMQLVLKRIALSRVPSVVGHDFNQDVTMLPSWDHFRQLGFAEFFQFYQHRFEGLSPATCRKKTRSDSLLLPPILQAMTVSASVEVDVLLFDSHDPLTVTFTNFTKYREPHLGGG